MFFFTSLVWKKLTGLHRDLDFNPIELLFEELKRQLWAEHQWPTLLMLLQISEEARFQTLVEGLPRQLDADPAEYLSQ